MATEKLTKRNTLEQGRAAFALKRASNAKDNSMINADEYKQYAKKLPMMIKTNGLGATLAFVFSKSKNKSGNLTAYGLLYTDMADWLKEPACAHLIDLQGNKNLVKEVVEMDSPQYKALTVEILAWLGWLRRFAEGLIAKKP